MRIEDDRDPGVEHNECIDCGDDCSILLERCTACQLEKDDLDDEMMRESYENFRRGR